MPRKALPHMARNQFRYPFQQSACAAPEQARLLRLGAGDVRRPYFFLRGRPPGRFGWGKRPVLNNLHFTDGFAYTS